MPCDHLTDLLRRSLFIIIPTQRRVWTFHSIGESRVSSRGDQFLTLIYFILVRNQLIPVCGTISLDLKRSWSLITDEFQAVDVFHDFELATMN